MHLTLDDSVLTRLVALGILDTAHFLHERLDNLIQTLALVTVFRTTPLPWLIIRCGWEDVIEVRPAVVRDKVF